MAKEDIKQKDEKEKDKEDKRRDVISLMDFSNEYMNGRFDEDDYIDAVMAITAKLGKGKKPKKVKDRDDLVLEVNNDISDYHISYIKRVILQVFNDTGLIIKLKL